MMKKKRMVLGWFLGVLTGILLTMTAMHYGWVGSEVTTALPQFLQTTSSGESLDSFALTKEERAKFETIAKLIDQKYVGKTERTQLVNGALDGFVDALGDPYSEYLDLKELQSFQEQVQSSFSGIGAEIALKDEEVVILSPIRNSPAERAGLRPGDIIVSVNRTILRGMTLSKAVELIRGPKGTQAKLIIRREGVSDPLEVIVVRDDIRVETVEATRLDESIGWIRISQFSVNTADRFIEELARLEKTRLRGLIIDVRNNPGGLVQSVQTIMNELVPKGKSVMHIEYRKGQREDTDSQGQGKPYPIVVLVNEGSASASEILAAALQESAGAQLVGKKTFGKGLVQMSFPLKDGTAMKLTTAKWLTPSGKMIHQQGIAPNVEVEQNALFSLLAIAKEKTWKRDAVGTEIENVQRILQALGYFLARTDGYFDQTTETAVKMFQERERLGKTGEVDRKTALRLEERVREAYNDPANDAQLQTAVQVLEKQIK